MGEQKGIKKNNNNRMSLRPLKFNEAVKAILEVKPEPRIVEGADSTEKGGYGNEHKGN
jgi:hypothetical protein